jgi:predicted RNA-binding Zn-ribbon protein involved in translation (DUF1610 family)
VTGPDPCPECGVDLAYQVDGKTYSRKVGVVINDKVAVYRCPDCGGQWTPRTDDGHPMNGPAHE